MSRAASGDTTGTGVSLPPVERDIIVSDDVSLRIREWPGSGPPLLLIHGFLGSGRSWGDLPGRLESAHVVAVDLPGHGASSGARSPEDVAVVRVAGLLNELQERVFAGPAAWLGYSMGGRIALAAAAEGIPMERLLLESAGPGLATEAERRERRRVDRRRADALLAAGIEAFVTDWLRMPLFRGLADLPPKRQALARALRCGQDPKRMAAWLLGGGTGSQPDYRPRLARVAVPVHLLVGEWDSKYVGLAQEMADQLPRAEVRVASGAGHLVHLESPDAWVGWVHESLTA